VTAPVLLFDGQCNLCNATVRFILDNERWPDFRFVPLRSARARELLAPFDADPDDLSSVLVLEDGDLYRESEAALRVLRHLAAPWRWLSILKVLPRSIRDLGYRFIGKRRYAWWGTVAAGACPLASPTIRDRFL
jgi:predicted DCC family thiol-disulfide oxidoreductase YuxK